MPASQDHTAGPEDDIDDEPRRPSHSSSTAPRRRSQRRSHGSSPFAPLGIFSPKNLRRAGVVVVVIVGLFVFGAFVVLATIQRYFSIPEEAYLTETEIPWKRGADEIRSFKVIDSSEATGLEEERDDIGVWGPDGKGSGSYWMRKDWSGKVQEVDSWTRLYNVSALPDERIPRIIHQTWKSDTLPDKWQRIWRECREGMPDYEYMLWTDELSRKFIHKHYPSFLTMFDGYEYPIQRADAIRYFILHHFGGIYMDLDIGCRRRLDPFLGGTWDVVLPRTKPVGVSNDLIFSSKGNAFMEGTVHGLVAFDHRYLLNYPTVMFSTGPMFLSAQFGLYSAAHPTSRLHPHAEVRIMPKSLYGKNAKAGEAPHSFFSHWYGSSWHADDADFIGFLGSKGKYFMYAGMVFVSLIALAAAHSRLSGTGSKRGLRALFGRNSESGRGQYHMVDISNRGEATNADDVDAASPVTSDGESDSTIADFARRAGHIILAAPATLLPSSSSRRRRSGILYFLPAYFAPPPTSAPTRRTRPRTASEASELPAHRRPSARLMRGPSRHGMLSMLSPVIDASESEFEAEPSTSASSNGKFSASPRSPPPPPYTGGAKDEAMNEVDEFLEAES